MLYIFWILHQTTTVFCHSINRSCCISFESYIKPQPTLHPSGVLICCISFESYIKPQLAGSYNRRGICCISFESYIKPQQTSKEFLDGLCCISFESYIKPQHLLALCVILKVVYLLNPTSNHNLLPSYTAIVSLYIFWILHQTTTSKSSIHRIKSCISFESYIKPQHRSQYQVWQYCCISFESYIKPQPWLHQGDSAERCISFESYIKPQPIRRFHGLASVVYLLNPTSNHNLRLVKLKKKPLYIFWILHQTTTWLTRRSLHLCCISFESYIKPQPIDLKVLISST